MIHYGVTKTGQVAVSRGLAEMTKGTRVTVNSVLPGATRSEAIVGWLQDVASTPNATPEIDGQVRKLSPGNFGLPIVTMQSTEIHPDHV